jgi:hypothetical protein
MYMRASGLVLYTAWWSLERKNASNANNATVISMLTSLKGQFFIFYFCFKKQYHL